MSDQYLRCCVAIQVMTISGGLPVKGTSVKVRSQGVESWPELGGGADGGIIVGYHCLACFFPS